MSFQPRKFPAGSVPLLALRLLSARVSSGNKHSRTNVLFPEPLTPVSKTSLPNGRCTVKSRKLFFLACFNVSQLNLATAFSFCSPTEFCRRPDLSGGPATGRRAPRDGWIFFARRHLPVIDSGCRSNSFSVPLATTDPP